MIPSRRRDDPYLLIVGMTGVKLGDRIVQIGCAHGGRLGAVAAKVGLSGRAVAVVPDEPSAAQARKGASQAGALVEVEVAPPSSLPLEAGAFDLALVDDTGGLLAAQQPDARAALTKEAFRVLKPGGRLAVSDVIVRGTVPDDIRRNVELWIGCVAGALEESEYRDKLRTAGFESIDVEPWRVYDIDAAREFLVGAGLDVEAMVPVVKDKFASAFIRARKPAAQTCCGPECCAA